MITVAICTHNRATSLNETLLSLTRQLDPPAWELLVIDNNSSDQTSQTVASFADRLPIRYVFEVHQGLSRARNRAMAEAQGDVVLFTDDDIVFDPGWLAAFGSAAKSHRGAAFFGGRVLPLWQTSRPRWLRDERMALLEGILGHYDLGTEVRPYGPDDPPAIGGSFAVRREAFDETEGFRTDLGSVGRKPGRGEETSLLGELRARAVEGVYVGSALAYHKVPPGRFSLPFLYRYGIESGIAAARIGNLSGGSVGAAMLFVLRGMMQLVRGRGDRFRQSIINAGVQVGLRRVPRGKVEPRP